MSDVTQGPLCDAAATSATGWWRDAVVYEVFVRSFQDGDGDGIGDLQGLRQRLDYLNDGDPSTNTDLGVTAIWLMPISPSPSYHGYDVTDYQGVNPEYGTQADFDALVADASTRGIHVVLDMVLNHSSDKHPWFVQGKRDGNPLSDYYLWRSTPPQDGWGQPWKPEVGVWHPLGARWYYGVFWEGMPDLNFRSEGLVTELRTAATFWRDHGVSGFRLDAARYLYENGPGDGQADQPETHTFWKSLRHDMGEDFLLLGEAWTDLPVTATYFGDHDELQSVFGFDRMQALRDGIRLGSPAAFGKAVCDEVTGTSANGLFASFIGNHDLDRYAGVAPDAAALRLAATLEFALPGLPVIYYGEELGLPNGAADGDLGKRLPMRWDDSERHGFTTASSAWEPDSADVGVGSVTAQQGDAGSLLTLYRKLIAVRRASPALSRGSLVRLPVDAKGVLAFVREADGERLLVVANFGKTESGAVGLPAALVTAGTGVDLLSGETLGPFASGITLPGLAARSARVIRLSE